MNFFRWDRKKRRLQKYLVSYPTIGLAIFIAFVLMMAYYRLQLATDVRFTADSYLHLAVRTLPSIVYSLVIIPLNIVYRLVSVYLTDWGESKILVGNNLLLFKIEKIINLENHRTQSSYESNLTTKLFVVNPIYI